MNGSWGVLPPYYFHSYEKCQEIRIKAQEKIKNRFKQVHGRCIVVK